MNEYTKCPVCKKRGWYLVDSTMYNLHSCKYCGSREVVNSHFKVEIKRGNKVNEKED